MGRILRGAAGDVQGLLQADGHQQGWPAGQERPARRLRQRRCPHERVRARRSAGRDLWTLHLRQHGQDVPGEDGRRGQRPRRPHRPGLQGLRQRGQDRLQNVRARPQDLGREEEEEEEEGRQVNASLDCQGGGVANCSKHSVSSSAQDSSIYNVSCSFSRLWLVGFSLPSPLLQHKKNYIKINDQHNKKKKKKKKISTQKKKKKKKKKKS